MHGKTNNDIGAPAIKGAGHLSPTPQYTILVIDDHHAIRNMILDLLDGHRRHGVSTAREGFLKFKEICPDIVFLDIGLPDEDGLTLLTDMIAYDPEAYIVVLTQSDVPQDVKMAHASGAAAYIIKPFTRQKLQSCIQQYEYFKSRLKEYTPEERKNHMLNKLRVEVGDKYKSLIEAPVEKQEPEDSEPQPEEKPVSQDELEKEIVSGWDILFVDDYHVNCEHAKEQMKHFNAHEIFVEESGKDALDMVKGHPCQIIFLDSQMPDMDGYETTRKIRKMEKDLKRKERAVIVGLFESEEEGREKKWLEVGMNEFVVKPIQFSHLKAIIYKHARHQIVMQKDIY